MAKAQHVVNLRIVDQRQGRGIPDLDVEAWDKDLVFDDALGTGITDHQGRCRLQFTSATFREWFFDHRPDLYFKIYQNKQEFHSTKDEVIWNYTTSDEELLVPIDVELVPLFLISGQVTSAGAVPVPGVVVKGFDQKLGKETLLSQTRTDDGGLYRINYTGRLPEPVTPDLFIQALGGDGKVVVTSELLCDAPRDARIDLVLPEGVYRPRSEYEQLNEAISQFGMDPKDLTAKDIEYLAAKLNRSSSKIRRYIHARRLGSEAQRANEHHRVPVEVFYGVISDDAETDLLTVVGRTVPTLQQSLRKAVEAIVILFLSEKEIEAHVAALKEIAVAVAETDPVDPSTYTVKRLVSNIKDLSHDLRSRFLRHHALNEKPMAEFWKAVEQDPDLGTYAAGLRDVFSLAVLTLYHQPLIDPAYAAVHGKISELAQWNSGEWKQFITANQITPPTGHSLETYAAALTVNFKAAFPMVDFLHAAKAGPIKPSKGLVQFFDQNGNFNLAGTAVDLFWKTANTKDIPKEVQDELKHWQRSYKLLPDDLARTDNAIVLGDLELDSWLKIASMRFEDFAARWAKHGGDPALLRCEATAIYNRSRFLSFMQSATSWNHAAALGPGSSPFMAPAYVGPAEGKPEEVAYIGETMANLTTLFGNYGYCGCEHCESVLSPSAYLVELFKSLGEPGRRQLDERRADVKSLHLDCKNTETQLPYIDLVNELLERMVAPAGAGWDLQTVGTAHELALRPEHEHRQAYVELARAIFPISLPWDKWFAEARLYLQHMHLPLHRLIELVIRVPRTGEGKGRLDFEKLRTEQLQSAKSVRAFLALTVPAYEVITKLASMDLTQIFGLEHDTLQEAEMVPVFMRQLGLWRGHNQGDTGRDDLVLMRQILGGRYVQDSRSKDSFPIAIDFSGEACDPGRWVLSNITKDTILRVTRFEHLRRAIGWTPHELHLAIMTFATTEAKLETTVLDKDFVRRISHLIRLAQGNTRFTVPELLSWWGRIETDAGFKELPPAYEDEKEQKRRITLYEAVFLDKSLFAANSTSAGGDQEWQYFQLNGDKTELQYWGPTRPPDPIGSHTAIVSAALRLTEDDLLRLVTFLESPSGSTPPPLTLTLHDLSALYRWVSLARYLGVTIQELICAANLIPITPFEVSADNKSEIATESTLLFVESVQRVHRSPFSVRDLAYLWQHEVEDEKELEYVVARITNYLGRLKERLASETSRNPDKTTWPDMLSAILTQDLGGFIDAQADVTNKLLDDALLQDFVGWIEEKVADPIIRDHVLRLEKTAWLIRAWKLTAAEVAHIDREASHFHDFKWRSIPVRGSGAPAGSAPLRFEQWSAIDQYVAVRNAISLTKGDLLELFRVGSTDEACRQLGLLLNLDPRDVQQIHEQLGYGEGDLRNGESIGPFLELTRAIKRCGGSFEAVRNWAGTPNESLDAGFPPHPGDLLTYKVKVVDQIRNGVKALSNAESWQAVAREFQDRMRIQQRDGLLDLLTTTPRLEKVPGSSLYLTPNDLYGYLLIDPLMNPCMNTTRLKQAISSVQLLVHRLLMGLEKPADFTAERLAELRGEWKWKQNYRVWEAYQKVFLFPENWIEPELRDDKSPFFEEFEGELGQSEIDARTIEKAFKNYLGKVDAVANLEIAAFKQQTSLVMSPTLRSPVAVDGDLHVIGRTRERPRTHYYRKRNPNGIWLPWERIDLDVDSDIVLLTIYRGTLYLFWPTIKERIQKLGQDNPDDKNNDKHNYLPVMEITFNWSRYDHGAWQPKKTTREHVDLMYDWKYKELFEEPEKLIRYEVEASRSSNQEDRGLVIRLSMMAGGVSTKFANTWDEERLEQQFLNLESLTGAIDWTYVQGSDFRLGAQDMLAMIKPMLDLHKQLVKLSLYGGEDAKKVSSWTEPLAGVARRKRRHIRSDGSEHNHWPEVPSKGSILGATLYGIPGKFDNIQPHHGFITIIDDRGPGVNYAYDNQGLFHKDIERIVEVFKEFDRNFAEAKIRSTIGLRRFEYRFLTVDHQGIGANHSVACAEMEFSGFKLRSRAYNSLGLVSSDGRQVLSTENIETRNLLERRDFAVSPLVSDYAIRDATNWIDADAGDGPHYRLQLENNAVVSTGTDSAGKRIRLGYGAGAQFHEVMIPYTGEVGDALLTLRDELDFRRFFYHDDRYCYGFWHDPSVELKYSTQTFYDPFVEGYNEILHNEDYDKSVDKFDLLLNMGVQKQERAFPYDTTHLKNGDPAKVDFDATTPFGLYNWEIFFHLPFVVAVRLSQNKRFEEAEPWFHRIFNPLASFAAPGNSDALHPAGRYWNVLPLHTLGERWTLVDLWRAVSYSDQPPSAELRASLEDQMAELAKDPFQPHRIARVRLGAYQRAVVIKYLDNLIAWGDHLFERDTVESINEAAHLYVRAAKILGDRPRLVPKPVHSAGPGVAGGRSVSIDGLRNYSPSGVTAEAQMMPSADFRRRADLACALEQGPPIVQQWYPDTGETDQPVFCVPHNDKWLSYWDTVADRLFKIRNCRNIEGRVRELPIFEPPIDPGLLVRGQALGIDIGELVPDLHAPFPPYRFRAMLQKAYEFCADVRNLGGELLAALEKKDAEELSLLRARHENQLLKLTEDIKRQQIKELRENLKSLQVSLEMAEARFDYYDSRVFENQNERQEVSKLNTAQSYQMTGQVASLAGSAAYGVPQFLQDTFNGSVTVETGGRAVGDAFQALAGFLQLVAGAYSHEAHMHSIQGGRERRMDEWEFQAVQARKEIRQLQIQALATEIRIDIAEKELTNHQTQREQAEEIETFMQSKFTNQQLYYWMVSQVSGLYFQSYKMAVDLARRTQRCWQLEKGDDAETYIGAAYWDSLKKGLLSGERLQMDLRRMEDAYLRKNTRELELTKHVSLKALDPRQLDTLRYTGTCTFKIPELLFDLDYPGHYRRRVKSLSVSVPAVVGPYGGVNCMLTLVKSELRKEGKPGELSPEPTAGEKPIALSSGQNDSGLFELTHDDERYLPFECRGAVSTWTLEFPSPCEQFDRSTISDVIVHMRYTALMGGPEFKAVVEAEIVETFRKIQKDTPERMGQRLDGRREFPDLWHKFTSGQDSNEIRELKLPLSKEHFPYLLRPLPIDVTLISLFCEMGEVPGESVTFEVEVQSSSVDIQLDKLKNTAIGSCYFSSAAVPLRQKFSVPKTLIVRTKPGFSVSHLKELIVVLHFTIGTIGQ
jgi:hypothetical protein